MCISSEHSYLDAVARGIRLYWRTLSEARDMCHVTGDIEYVISSSHCGPERIFGLRLSPDHASRQVDEIIAGIRSGVLPNGLLLTPDSKPGNLPQILIVKGFQIDASHLCMVADLDELHFSFPGAASIQVRVVDAPGLLKQWVAIVNAALFGYEIMSLEQFSDLACLANTRLYLGTYEGAAAATAMTITEPAAEAGACGPTATLEMVSTLPEYRRRGLGSALIAAALRDLQERGIRLVTLRADPDAIRLYEKAGFRGCCDRVVASYPLDQPV